MCLWRSGTSRWLEYDVWISLRFSWIWLDCVFFISLDALVDCSSAVDLRAVGRSFLKLFYISFHYINVEIDDLASPCLPGHVNNPHHQVFFEY
jgi:hypothetical protein